MSEAGSPQGCPVGSGSSHIGSACRSGTALGYDIDAGTSGLVIWHVMLDANGRLYRVPADRANCKGKTFPVPTLFTRAGPEWKLGGGRGYWGGDGPFRPKWMDGTEVGIEISVAKHEQVEWAIEVSWTARCETAVAQQAGGGRR